MQKRTRSVLLCAAAATFAGMMGQRAVAQTALEKAVEKTADGVIVPVNDGFLNVTARTNDVLHVMFAKDRSAFAKPSIGAIPPSGPTPKWELTNEDGAAVVSTSNIKAKIDLKTGAITYMDSSGKTILAEKPDGRKLESADVQGEKTFHVRQQWQGNASESLYGLGQFQLGLTNIKNYDLDLWQHNGTIIAPFLVSSKGYGILWDNPSYTRFGDLGEFATIPAANLIDMDGKPGGLTMGMYMSATQPAQNLSVSANIAIGRGGGGVAGGQASTPNAGGATTTPAPANAGGGANAGAGNNGGNGGANGGGGQNRQRQRAPQGTTRWEGKISPTVAGDYQFQTYSNGSIKVWIDDKLVIDHFRQSWLPWYDVARVALEAGKPVAMKVEWAADGQGNILTTAWKTPVADREAQGNSLWSEVGDGVDYYFCYGPSLDRVMAGSRAVTGKAVMLPNWSFGFWQSRDHYSNQQESIDAVAEFRKRQIPLDNIVQDWQYWPGASLNTVGSGAFDSTRFPDPVAWSKAIHDQHAHLMISVWGWVSAQSTPNDNYKDLLAKNYLLGATQGRQYRTFVDFFNPEAGKFFWDRMNTQIFSKGVDAWWLDASEPDLVGTPTLDAMRTGMNPNGMGTGARVLNGYPLVESKAIYEGQRTAAPDQRVFILTRSGYPGMQRYAAAIWSGDTTSTWPAMRKQIMAGLGASISGLPYWTMDIGGYQPPPRFTNIRDPEDRAEWDELNTRWLQFGTFVPLMRIHGQGAREVYNFGETAQQAMIKYDKLRYALMPYIYSIAGAVTHDDATMMRPLVMDFPADAKSREVADEYMFGPAFLCSPVSAYKARTRSVYLPPAAGWYEFWSGKASGGGTTVEADAPYDSMPLFLKAGSIVPTSAVMQYVGEKPADPTTLYVYTGADGTFTLYDDEGTNYNYEKGAFARIPLNWNEATKTLTIGKRTGDYPGMQRERTFNVIFVSKEKPAGFDSNQRPTNR